MSKLNSSILALLAAMLSIQGGAAVAKGVFPLVGAAGMSALRAGLAALMLAGFWQPWRQPLGREELKPVLTYGLALGCMNLSFYLALARIPLGLAVALEFTGPLALALLNSRRRLDFVWGLLAALGVGLILRLDRLMGNLSAGLDPLGIGLALFAGLCWAIYIVCGKKAEASAGGQRAATWGMMVAAAAILPFGIREAGPRLLAPAVLPPALGVALLSSALPYSLEMIALRHLPARTFSILLSLEPACAALSGLVILHEQLGWIQGLAMGLIMVASFGSAWSVREHARDALIAAP